MARPLATPSTIISASVNDVESAAVDRFARDNRITRSEAIGQLIRLGFREAIGERAPLVPVLSPNEYDGVDLTVSFRRADVAVFETILEMLAGYTMARHPEELH